MGRLIVAVTIVDGCYDNLSRLLWRYVAVAMEIDDGCYGNKVWLCTYTLWLCRYVGLTLVGANRKDILLTEITLLKVG